MITVEEQAKIFGADEWEFEGQYVHFYCAGVFAGASNMKYLTKSNR